VKTSLRYLARGLGADGPDQCAAAVLQAPDWKARLNRFLETLEPPPSGHTVRNTRNNLSWLARQAYALALLDRDLQAKARAFLRQALPPATPPRPRGHPPA
jgi:hypothetical protein